MFERNHNPRIATGLHALFFDNPFPNLPLDGSIDCCHGDFFHRKCHLNFMYRYVIYCLTRRRKKKEASHPERHISPLICLVQRFFFRFRKTIHTFFSLSGLCIAFSYFCQCHFSISINPLAANRLCFSHSYHTVNGCGAYSNKEILSIQLTAFALFVCSGTRLQGLA